MAAERRANLIGADLDGTILFGADLTGADFSRAEWSGTMMSDGSLKPVTKQLLPAEN